MYLIKHHGKEMYWEWRQNSTTVRVIPWPLCPGERFTGTHGIEDCVDPRAGLWTLCSMEIYLAPSRNRTVGAQLAVSCYTD